MDYLRRCLGWKVPPGTLIIFINVNANGMNPEFHIVCNLKTGHAPESFGRFSIGHSRAHAYQLFRQLKGNREVSEKDILLLEFMETRNGLPTNIDIMSCNLDQLAENCKIITKELFKLRVLESSTRMA